MKSETYIEVCQIRSLIGRPHSQRVLMKSLGLRKIGHKVFLPNTSATRGIIEKVQHMLCVCVRFGGRPSNLKRG